MTWQLWPRELYNVAGLRTNSPGTMAHMCDDCQAFDCWHYSSQTALICGIFQRSYQGEKCFMTNFSP